MITLLYPRHHSLRERFDNSYIGEPNSGCWLWDAQYRGNNRPSIESGGKRRMAHRVAYELYKGPIPPGAVICHHCDVTLCVNPAHLYAGTQKTNMDDMRRRGRSRAPRGSKHPRARITEGQAVEIFRDPSPYRRLAESYGVVVSTISDIKNGHTWKHATTAVRQ